MEHIIASSMMDHLEHFIRPSTLI